MRGSRCSRLASIMRTWLVMTMLVASVGPACSGKGNATGDSGADTDTATGPGGEGAGGTTGGGSAGGPPGGAGSGGATAGIDAGIDAGTDAGDLSKGPIRNCVQRLNGLRADCAG